MTALNPCPCGKTPEKLQINDGSTYRWRWVSGDCCGEWSIEARVFYGDDEATVYEKCVNAWNASIRVK